MLMLFVCLFVVVLFVCLLPDLYSRYLPPIYHAIKLSAQGLDVCNYFCKQSVSSEWGVAKDGVGVANHVWVW